VGGYSGYDAQRWQAVSFSSAGTRQEIQEAFAEAGIDGLPASCYDQFFAYLGLLLRWNARLSLTAIREPKEIIRRHFVECAFAAQHLPADIECLLDYGSGAGLPGVAIAICRPEIRVTLAEAQGKKASFLREVVRTIGTNAEVYDGRAETMPPGRPFHAVSMRAVEKMELAIPIALRLAERYLVLLTTERSAPAYRELTPELHWLDPIPLPNAEHAILAVGHRTERAAFPD
jgi:16S rRNA (guanine527-N7)-methyltransferase